MDRQTAARAAKLIDGIANAQAVLHFLGHVVGALGFNQLDQLKRFQPPAGWKARLEPRNNGQLPRYILTAPSADQATWLGTFLCAHGQQTESVYPAQQTDSVYPAEEDDRTVIITL